MAEATDAARPAAARRRLLLLWLAGMDLRLTILAVPPVLPLIHRDLALDEKSVAALTGLPVLLFGLVAVPGSLLIARIGARRAVITGLIVVALASALRGLGPSTPMLFAMTFLMGAGVAVLQPAMPALVGAWFHDRVGFATAVYANGLLIGEVLAAGITLTLVLPLTGGSWEWSFAVWAVPVLATALVFRLGTPGLARGATHVPTRWWPDWRQAQTWQLGLLQGGASALYFGSNAFLPDYLHATGQAGLVNACLTGLNAGQVPASFLILATARHLTGRREPFIAAALLGLAGIAALLLKDPAVMVAGTVVIGFAAAFVLILTLALPPLLVPAGEVHRLSAGVLTISYTVTFLVPFLGGSIWDATGITLTAFLPGAVGALLVLVLAAALKPVRAPG